MHVLATVSSLARCRALFVCSGRLSTEHFPGDCNVDPTLTVPSIFFGAPEGVFTRADCGDFSDGLAVHFEISLYI